MIYLGPVVVAEEIMLNRNSTDTRIRTTADTMSFYMTPAPYFELNSSVYDLFTYSHKNILTFVYFALGTL